MSVEYVSRIQWGAGPLGAGHKIDHGRFSGLAVHHTVAILRDYDRDGFLHGDLDDVIRYMRTLQKSRPDLGPEIPYSFVVFRGSTDGACIVAEGRGFGITGAHTAGHNSSRYGVAYAGNASIDTMTMGVLEGFRWVGQHLAHPETARPTIGHRDVKATECPGNHLYAALRKLQPPFFSTPDSEDFTMAGLSRVDAQKGVVRHLLRTVLLRNPNDPAELEFHRNELDRRGYEGYVEFLIDSPEGQAVLKAERSKVLGV